MSRPYRTGYNLERYCMLTLEYNKYHIFKKYKSLGIEDIVAYNGYRFLMIQAKNDKNKGRYAMSKDEQLIFKKHAQEINAIPIYLYTEDKKKHWVNLLINDYFDDFKPFTSDWLAYRSLMKKRLKIEYKKGKKHYKKYVLDNWEDVKWFVCT